jgi:putative intracellular protease/amidase
MSATINAVTANPRRVLMVVASPSVSTTLGWPVGFWASEFTHPWLAFTEAGYAVQVASPRGGRVELDALSDPRDPSGYSAHDLISLGFLHTPALAAMLESTRPLAECRATDYDAIVVCGGQSPMFTFPAEAALHRLLAEFYAAEKVTAALCHGVAALLHVTLADGTPLLRGRTITGFANSEEDIADAMVGRRVMPFRIEDEARALGANYITAPAWRPFAFRDGRLVTGQQQYSGAAVARLVIEALGQ